MNSDILRVLIDEKKLDSIITEVAEKIDNDYRDRGGRILLLGILKGSVVFMGELMKKLTLPNLEIDFMKVSSYGAGTTSSGTVTIHLDLVRKDLSDCDIIIIEDIIDSGRTLAYLREYLELKGAKSVKTCTLLDKPSRRELEFTPDYVGCEIPDEFVVGFGLDYDEKYRALPYIGILRPEAYQK